MPTACKKAKRNPGDLGLEQLRVRSVEDGVGDRRVSPVEDGVSDRLRVRSVEDGVGDRRSLAQGPARGPRILHASRQIRTHEIIGPPQGAQD